MQVAALLQDPYAELKPGGDVDAAQWKEVASLPDMRGELDSRAKKLSSRLPDKVHCIGVLRKSGF